MGVSCQPVLSFIAGPVRRWKEEICCLHDEAFMLTRLWPLIMWTEAILKGRVQHLDAEHYNRYLQAVRDGMSKHPLTYHHVSLFMEQLGSSIRLLLIPASLLGQPIEAVSISRTIFPWLMQITGYVAMMQKLRLINVLKLDAIVAVVEFLRLSATCKTIRRHCTPTMPSLRELVEVQTPWDYWHGTRPFIPFLDARSFQLLVQQTDSHRPSRR